MSAVDIPDPDREPAPLAAAAARKRGGPTLDLLGTSFFLFHLGVSLYILCGWMVPVAGALVFYLAVLPLIAMQWLVNRGSCVIDNIETVLRTGRWRDPARRTEGRFLSMIILWMFGIRARPAYMDAVSYGGLFVFWLLAFQHLSVLGDPALLSLFP